MIEESGTRKVEMLAEERTVPFDATILWRTQFQEVKAQLNASSTNDGPVSATMTV